MRTVALNSPDVNLSAAPADVWFGAEGSETPVRAGKPDREIDAFVAALCAAMWPPGGVPFELDFGDLFKDVKPWPHVAPRRVRSCNQRDLARNLRAAKAAGANVREIMPDGRLILGEPDRQIPSGNGMAKDAADVVAARLKQ
jgi:hypothetical protein